MTDLIYGIIENNQFRYATPEEVNSGECETYNFDMVMRMDTNPQEVIIIDNILTDITDTSEYIAEQKSKEKAIQKAEILKQIDELEQSQARAIREIALNKDTTFAMGKLQSLDEQIIELRGQLNA